MFQLIILGCILLLLFFAWVINKIAGRNKIKKKPFDELSITLQDLRRNLADYVGEWILSPEYEIKKVRLTTQNAVIFVFSLKQVPLETIEKIDSETKLSAERVIKGEIASMENLDWYKKEKERIGLKVFNLDADYIFKLIKKVKFPPTGTSISKPESWVDTNAWKKIQNVEFTSEMLILTVGEDSAH
jgi:hypothetical protein